MFNKLQRFFMGESKKQKSQVDTSEIHQKFKEFWVNNGDKFSELIHIGGWSPTGYGDVEENEKELYGRSGLTEREFLLHVHFVSKVSGMVNILGDDHLEWLQDRIEEEWERVKNKKLNSEEE